MTIRIPGKANIESVMVFQLAKGLANGAALANAERRVYSSAGEFLFFSTHAGLTAANTIATADQPPAAAAPATSGVHSIRLVYGGVEYPASPVETATSDTSGLDFTRLYSEYKKAMNMFGARSGDLVPYSIFCKTMPFAFFNPNAPDAPKLSSPGDIAIETTSGAVTSGINVVVVAFQHRILQLDAAGGAKITGEN